MKVHYKIYNYFGAFSILFLCGILFATTNALARNIFLNGIDISSARHQLLENVTIRIDGQGHLYIEADHYQVNEESHFVPLSDKNATYGRPEHKQRRTFAETAPEKPLSNESETPTQKSEDNPLVIENKVTNTQSTEKK